MTDEAVRDALPIEFEGRIFPRRTLIASAASVGRPNDRARIEQMLEQADFDRSLLDAILTSSADCAQIMTAAIRKTLPRLSYA